MWSRKDVKKRGRESFKKNYWKSVLVAVILSIVIGASGASGGFSGGSGGSAFRNVQDDQVEKNEDQKDKDSDTETVDENDDSADASGDGKDEAALTVDGSLEDKDGLHVNVDTKNITNKLVNMDEKAATTAVIIIVVAVAIAILIAIILAALVDILICNPIEMGCNRYFYKNLEEDAGIANAVYAFDHNYKNIVKCLFYRDMYLVLWGMLFIIPGIIKSYEYRMIPYLLAENPDMTKEDAFAESKKMMSGNKWKAFVLDLSFIGWELLSILTCGLLSIFFVNPYKYSTRAALYETLRYGKENA